MNAGVLTRILSSVLFLSTLLIPARSLFAQTSDRPVVTIVASDHHAAEAEQAIGAFTVSRTGNTEASLLVFYQLSGTARNGADYQELPGTITIPAGAVSAPVTIKPINDSLAEGTETIVATLIPSLTLSPIEPYRVGFPSSDVILLADNDSPETVKPVVTIEATDPLAAEIPEVPPGMGLPQRHDPAIFTVRRTGSTDAALEVRYRIDGTAVSGVDYTKLAGVVRIPPGSALGTIEVNPIDDGAVEGAESVVVILLPNDCNSSPPTPGCYAVGEHSQATASIADDDTAPHSPPTVAIVQPTAGATFVAPARIEITATAKASGAWIRAVELFAGDRSLGVMAFNGLTGSFRLIWENVSSGEYTLTAKVTDSLGTTAWSSPIHIAVKPAEVLPILLVARGALWKYIDNGSDQGTAWRGPEFVDSEWKSGPAQLGFGDGDEATVLRAGNEERRFVTYYFRRAFELSNLEGISGLTLRLLRDDGAVVYLNGHEVFRNNMPDGPITFNTLALQGVGTDGESVFHSVGIDPRLLVSGRNILAVEVHQVSIESTDLSFDLELAAGAANAAAVVNIEATDAEAAEISPLVGVAPNPAVFKVTRTGATSKALRVYYRLTGTASNGVDYRELSGVVTIPEGAASAEIVVQPIDDTLVEGRESVVAALVPLILIDPPSGSDPYVIGSHPNAEVHIRDNDELPPNAPPTVKIVQPVGGSAFGVPAKINIVAEVRDPDGWVGLVEFFANERKIGEQSVIFVREPDPGQLQSFSFEWREVPQGDYALVARATDDRSGKGASDPVRVQVGEAVPTIPVVTIIASDAFAREGTNSSGEMNTAAFHVRRTGEANTDLTVFLSIHGTAVNGVDYESIPTTATIPAGRQTARIGVRPIRDEQKEPVETVLLMLEPDPSLGPVPRYTLGEASKAAAAIADGEQPASSDFRTADGLFHLSLPGEDGAGFRLECSTDLIHWLPLCTNVVTDGAIHFVDPDAEVHVQRFYRVVPESNVNLDN